MDSFDIYYDEPEFQDFVALRYDVDDLCTQLSLLHQPHSDAEWIHIMSEIQSDLRYLHIRTSAVRLREWVLQWERPNVNIHHRTVIISLRDFYGTGWEGLSARWPGEN